MSGPTIPNVDTTDPLSSAIPNHKSSNKQPLNKPTPQKRLNVIQNQRPKLILRPIQDQTHPQDLNLSDRLRYNTKTDQEIEQFSIPITPLPRPILKETPFDLELALQHAWIGSLLPPNWVIYIISLASELFVDEPNLIKIVINNDVQLPTGFDVHAAAGFSTNHNRNSQLNRARSPDSSAQNGFSSLEPSRLPHHLNNHKSFPLSLDQQPTSSQSAPLPTVHSLGQGSSQSSPSPDCSPHDSSPVSTGPAPFTPDTNVTSNICIVGDLHGQFYDLLSIFRRNDIPPRRRYLFLGDVVDRGACSIESIMLILLLKIKYPNSVWLIRGNHESTLSMIYGFNHEVMTKYLKTTGPKLTKALVSKLHNTPLLGKKCDPALGKPHCLFTPAICNADPFSNTTIYSQFLYLFMTLPLAAVIGTLKESSEYLHKQHGDIELTDIDPQAFCVHGGTSPQIRFLNKIDTIYRFIEIEDNSSSPVVDLLWSDPTLDFKTYHKSTRGCGYTFGQAIWDSFTADNKIDTIIRSHELKPFGLQIYEDKVITVWSAPNYLRHYRNKACVLILRSAQYDAIQEQIKVVSQRYQFRTAPKLALTMSDYYTHDSKESNQPHHLPLPTPPPTTTSVTTPPGPSSPLSDLSLVPPLHFPPPADAKPLVSFAVHQQQHEELRRQRKYEQQVLGIYQPLYTTVPPHPYYVYAQNDSEVDRAVHDQLVKPIDDAEKLFGPSPTLSWSSRVSLTSSSMGDDSPPIIPRMTALESRPRAGSNASNTASIEPEKRPRRFSNSVGNGSSSWFDDPVAPAPTQHQPPRPPGFNSSAKSSKLSTTTAEQACNVDYDPSLISTVPALTLTSTTSTSTSLTTNTTRTMTTISALPTSVTTDDKSDEADSTDEDDLAFPFLEPPVPKKFLYHIVDVEQFPDQYANEMIALTAPLKHVSFTSVYGTTYTNQYDDLTSPSFLQTYFGTPTPLPLDSPSVKPSSHRQQRQASADPNNCSNLNDVEAVEPRSTCSEAEFTLPSSQT